jgi:MFS family permease
MANYDRVVWGVCMTSMGYVTDFSGLMAARFFLGLAEAGLFPGVNYYLSCWYKRDEFGVRAVSSRNIRNK